jgi:O-antigen/teichoic acid export membrane protein
MSPVGRPPSLRRNVVANYVGQSWRVVIGLAFVPIYVRYLGVEAYGLIGVFAMMQTWLGLLDLGMRPTLGREMARFGAGAHDAQSIRDLLRSIELVVLALALPTALGIWAASGWLARGWLDVDRLPLDEVARAIALMGLVAVLRFAENVYASALVGLQRQVLQNVVTGAAATLRAVGAVAVLAWASPTVEAFFLWQGLVSLLTVGVLAAAVDRILPRSPRPARGSWTALLDIWRFAAGMMAITVLSLALTQVDKLLLSRTLPLETFGYYTLAGTVAASLYALTGPINAAFYPRFVELATQGGREAELRAAYHLGAQLVTVLVGGAAITIIAFAHPVMFAWTGDPALADRVAPLAALLTLGTMLNGLVNVPYQLQLAHGWTSLTIRVNVIAVAIIVPAILWLVPRYGAPGAAWAWVALNGGYVFFEVSVMHRRLLRGSAAAWYLRDVAIPLAAATGVAFLARLLLPDRLGRVSTAAALVVVGGAVLAAGVAAAPAVRSRVLRRRLVGRDPASAA